MNFTKTSKMILLLITTLFLLTACNGETKSSTEETLKIGLLRIDDSIPFYVAQEEGLFEKYHVQVELVEFKSGKDQSLALESGELDGLMTDMAVQGLIKKSGTEIKTVAMALGAKAEEGRFLVVSAPESGILTPEDLLGKTVAASNNTMMDYLLEQFERIYQLPAEDINQANIPDLMLRTTMLLEGKDIDAAILPDPLAAYAVMEGANVVIDDTQLAENLSQSVVAITDQAINDKTTAVENMLKAYFEAMTLINEQPENYRELCLNVANVPQELAQTYPTPTYSPKTIPSEEEVARIVDWLVSRQLIEKNYTYTEMVDDRFVQ